MYCSVTFYCLFVILVGSHFGFEGKTLVMFAPVPDHCNFFSYSQTLFGITVLISNSTNVCICSFMPKKLLEFHHFTLSIVKTGSSCQVTGCV